MKADYTLKDLNIWYERLRDPVWAYPEITGSDLDERLNRIEFKIRDMDLVSEVQKTIAAEGVPIDAVVFHESAPYPYIRKDILYDESVLAGWWETLREHGLKDHPGVASAYLDEDANRIYISVESRKDVDPLLTFLDRAKVPWNATLIELETPGR